MYDLFNLMKADIRAMGHIFPDLIQEVVDFEIIVRDIIAQEPALRRKDLVINGHDIMKLGVPPSKEISIILKRLTEEVIDDFSKNDKEYLIKRAEELWKENQ